MGAMTLNMNLLSTMPRGESEVQAIGMALVESANRYAKTENTAAIKTNQLRDLKTQLDDLALEIDLKIEYNGKNAEQRKLERQQTFGQHGLYQQLRREIAKMEADLTMLDAERTNGSKQFRAMERVAELASAYLRYTAVGLVA